MSQMRQIESKGTSSMSTNLWQLIFEFAEDSPDPLVYLFAFDALSKLLNDDNKWINSLVRAAFLVRINLLKKLLAPEDSIDESKPIYAQLAEIYPKVDDTIYNYLSSHINSSQLEINPYIKIFCELNPQTADNLVRNCFYFPNDLLLYNACQLINAGAPISSDTMSTIFEEFDDNEYDRPLQFKFTYVVLAILKNGTLFSDKTFQNDFYLEYPDFYKTIMRFKVYQTEFINILAPILALKLPHMEQALDLVLTKENLCKLIDNYELETLKALLAIKTPSFINEVLIHTIQNKQFYAIDILIKSGANPSEVIENFYYPHMNPDENFNYLYQLLRQRLKESKSMHNIQDFEPLKNILKHASAHDDTNTIDVILQNFPGLFEDPLIQYCIRNALQNNSMNALSFFIGYRPECKKIILDEAIPEFIKALKQSAEAHSIYKFIIIKLIKEIRELSEASYRLLEPFLLANPNILHVLMDTGLMTPERINRQQSSGGTLLFYALEKNYQPFIEFAAEHGGDFLTTIGFIIKNNYKNIFTTCLAYPFCQELIAKHYLPQINNKHYIPILLAYDFLPQELKPNAECKNIIVAYQNAFQESEQEYKNEIKNYESKDHLSTKVINFLTSHTNTLFSGPSAHLIQLLKKGADPVTTIRHALTEELGKSNQDKRFLHKLIFIKNHILPKNDPKLFASPQLK